MDRREFLVAAGRRGGRGRTRGTRLEQHPPHCPPADPLEELSLADIAAAFADGRMTSQQLTQSYLTRIDKLDRRGPTLSSVIETNPRALEIAAALDAERKTRGARGPLHGVPVLIKDNVETSDHMMSTAGSLALRGLVCAQGCAAGRAPAGRGRRDFGQDQLERVGQFSLHAFLERLERPRRPVPQSLRHRSHALGLELRIGGRGLRESVRALPWVRKPTARS